MVHDFGRTASAKAEVLTKLGSLQKEHLIELVDACVVVDIKEAKVQIKQALNLPVLGCAGGLLLNSMVPGAGRMALTILRESTFQTGRRQ